MGRRRSKGPDIVDLAKLIFAFIVLLALAGTGTLKGTAAVITAITGSFLGLLVGVFVLLGVLGAVFVFIAVIVSLFRKKTEVPAPSRGNTYRAPRENYPRAYVTEIPAYVSEVPTSVADTYFTRKLLEDLEWHRFELLVMGYFRMKGYDANRTRVGPDGGVDIIVRKDTGTTEISAYVQCKAWRTYTVGVKPVRELFGVMAADGVAQGYFVATGNYTSEAKEFADFKPLKLVSGDDLLEKLNGLDDDKRKELYRETTSGDYTTPTCPKCDIKMVKRPGKHGEFWGCPNFGPKRCQQSFQIAKG